MDKMKSGVVIMTLTDTINEKKERRTYSSRIDFCAQYNKVTLSKMGKKKKKIYAKQIEEQYKDVPVKPNKYSYRISTKATECELILSGE